MPEGLVRQRRDELDAFGLERRRALGHDLRGDAERELQGGRAWSWQRVVELPAMGSQRQARRSDAILEPAVAQGTYQRELHDRLVEVPHRFNVADEDDGVIDLANLAESLHDESFQSDVS